MRSWLKLRTAIVVTIADVPKRKIQLA